MTAISFQSPGSLNFNATLAVGQWQSVTIAASDAPPGAPIFNLDQFTSTTLRVTASALPELAFQVAEGPGDPYLHLAVDNWSGAPLTIAVPAADTVIVNPGQSVQILYHRHAARLIAGK